jgi:hypothetical protein
MPISTPTSPFGATATQAVPAARDRDVSASSAVKVRSSVLTLSFRLGGIATTTIDDYFAKSLTLGLRYSF